MFYANGQNAAPNGQTAAPTKPTALLKSSKWDTQIIKMGHPNHQNGTPKSSKWDIPPEPNEIDSGCVFV